MAHIDSNIRWELERREKLLQPGSEQEVLVMVHFHDLNFEATSVPGIKRYTYRTETQDRQLVTGNFQAVELLRSNPAIKSAEACVGGLMHIKSHNFDPETIEGVIQTSRIGDIASIAISTTGIENSEQSENIISISGD